MLRDSVTYLRPTLAVVGGKEDTVTPRAGKDLPTGVNGQRRDVGVSQSVIYQRPVLALIRRAVNASAVERPRKDVSARIDGQGNDEWIVQPVVDRSPGISVARGAKDTGKRSGKKVSGRIGG